MNRLLKKIRDFGLVFLIDSEEPERISEISQALKKAHIPVVLHPFREGEVPDRVKISNNSEDMFIGADCPCSYGEISRAFASGAHFAFTSLDNSDSIKRALSSGLDLYIKVDSREEIEAAAAMGASAVLINGDSALSDTLISYAADKAELPFFLLSGRVDNPYSRWQLGKMFIAYIVTPDYMGMSGRDITTAAAASVRRMLGMEYRCLRVNKNSERTAEAEAFTGLSSIPLIESDDSDLLEITVKDMDRTIAHLKWREIYMDPLSARMDGEKILQTDLYTSLLGWMVRLIASS